MRERNNIIMEYGTYMLVFLASYIASLAGLYYLSGILLMGEALYLYVHWVRETGSLVELRALFTLAWVGGQGIACMQLSKLQSDWQYITWLSFFLIYIGFGIGYEWGRKYGKVEERELEKNEFQSGRLFICIIGLMAVSIACFVFEAIKVGFIPLFSDEPHAYSYFHVSGVHYFTISLYSDTGHHDPVPKSEQTHRMEENSSTGTGKLYGRSSAVLMRIQIPELLFAVGFAVVTYIMVNKRIRLRTMVILLVALVPVYIILTVFRHHDVTYLNSIFEMKYSKMPIFITQPYMYVANNFENFNCMVAQLTEHTYGLKMLFPFFALTGLKFLYPQLVSFPIFLTKKELTTLTMFYDAYYDFGIVGVFIFAVIIGAVAKVLMSVVKKSQNPVSYLFYGQIAIYLGLAFLPPGSAILRLGSG
ncbi:MAG: O-antigen polymerase [[Clostridium] scindens]